MGSQVVTKTELREINEQVEEDIARARARGLLWTPPREFINDAEKLGAMRCSRAGCSKRSDTVSYGVRVAGRVAYCGEHEPRTTEREVLR